MTRLRWGAALLALAAAHAEAAGTPAKPAESDKPRLVCFSDAPTGSHLRKRTCMTQADYEERRKRDKEAMERMKPIERPTHRTGGH